MRTGLKILLAATGVVAGCREADVAPGAKGKEGTATPAAGTMPPITTNALDIFSEPGETVLVTVAQKSLTLGEARDEIETRLAGLGDRLAPDQVAKRRPRMLAAIVDQFVMRTLLLDEAERHGITVTPEDEAKAFDQIRERLPKGKTLEEVMKESPLGEERMRREVLVGVRINKLLGEVLPKEKEITDAEIDNFIANNPEARLPESVSARHILIKTEESDSDDVKAEKLRKTQDIRRQLLEGADFATLAAEVSECPSRQRGGSLGTFKRGQMVKAFEDAAFSQEPGVVGDVVSTQFGYHIILVDKRNDAGDIPRDRVVEMLRSRHGREAYEKFLVDLRNKADITYGVQIPRPAQEGTPRPNP